MIRLRAPGRICLFGEHQDYLGYPVIALAISKYIYLEAERIQKPLFLVEMPDINETLEIELKKKELDYQSKRDYLRSGYNNFLRKKIKFNKGYKIKITGDIPINAGVSSSSALVMVWLSFLNLISGEQIKKKSDLAIEGYNSEVKEFSEGGGMMDHYTSIYGNLVYLEPILPRPTFMAANVELEGFVLGNSLEKKETVDDLLRTKKDAMEAFNALKEIMPKFDQFYTPLEEIKPILPNLKKSYQKKIIGNITNRDITLKAKQLMINNFPYNFYIDSYVRNNFYQQLGTLLNNHHYQLKENIGISTKKIDTMLSNCLEKGAFGGKINGSGFGGTMFVLAPDKEQLMTKVIEDTGGDAYIITTSTGVEQF